MVNTTPCFFIVKVYYLYKYNLYACQIGILCEVANRCFFLKFSFFYCIEPCESVPSRRAFLLIVKWYLLCKYYFSVY